MITIFILKFGQGLKDMHGSGDLGIGCRLQLDPFEYISLDTTLLDSKILAQSLLGDLLRCCYTRRLSMLCVHHFSK